MDENISAANSDPSQLIDLMVEIVSAYVSNNSVSAAELPPLVASVHATISQLSEAPVSEEQMVDRPTSAQIRKSITPEALISFVDGKSYKTLKRHLNKNGMTLDQYRERYGLPRDYPATASSYSERRSELARTIGLGQQRRKAAAKATDTAETVAESPKSRSSKKAVEPVATPGAKTAKARSSKKPPVVH